MEEYNGKDFAKSASMTFSPEADSNVVEQKGDDGGESALAFGENKIISEKIGTKKDQLDMIRMGKKPELRVC